MIGWYTWFISDLAEIKLPLNKLLHKGVEWHWSEDQQRAFEKLKEALISAPILVRPDFELPFILQTDASSHSVAGVLAQEHEDGEHALAYTSRVLLPAEINCLVTEKECLAMIHSVCKFRQYIEGYPFKVITDHSSLRWLRTLQDPVGRLSLWALELQQYPYTIEQRKGAMHHVPDALSRYQEQFASLEEIDDQWYTDRLADVLARLVNYPDWKVEDGMLQVHRENELLDLITEAEFNWGLVVPKPLRNRVMTINQDAPSHSDAE